MKKRKDRNLAEGEVTGHAHRCSQGTVYDCDDGTRLLDTDGCEVTHEEHNTIQIPAGRFTTIIATEQDHFAQKAREVQD
jgi:hypothetical protein